MTFDLPRVFLWPWPSLYLSPILRNLRGGGEEKKRGPQGPDHGEEREVGEGGVKGRPKSKEKVPGSREKSGKGEWRTIST